MVRRWSCAGPGPALVGAGPVLVGAGPVLVGAGPGPALVGAGPGTALVRVRRWSALVGGDGDGDVMLIGNRACICIGIYYVEQMALASKNVNCRCRQRRIGEFGRALQKNCSGLSNIAS